MDTRLLTAFVQVAENASFSHAAEALHLTQPAVSKRIAALESQIERPLFDRVGRQIVLTEAGQTLLPYARRVLREVEDGRRALSSLSGRVAGHLSLGISHHIGLHRLPSLLRDYVKRYPAVELDMHFVESEQGCAAVEHGHLELALVTLPARPELLECLEVWPDPMSVTIAADHPLVGADAPGMEDLMRYPVLLPDRHTFTHALIADAFHRHGLSPRVLLATNSLETIKMLVGIGLGWSVLPRSMLDDTVSTLDVGLSVQRRLGVVRHPQRSRSNAAQALLDLLSEIRR